MGIDRTVRFCKRCGRQTPAMRQGANHVIHFIMTLLTLGLWLVIWLLCAIRIGGWRCEQCGGRV